MRQTILKLGAMCCVLLSSSAKADLIEPPEAGNYYAIDIADGPEDVNFCITRGSKNMYCLSGIQELHDMKGTLNVDAIRIDEIKLVDGVGVYKKDGSLLIDLATGEWKGEKAGLKGDSCQVAGNRIICGNTFVSLDSLKGPKGDPGEDGKDGAPGKDGSPGVDGKDGAPGRDGEPGTPGLNGRDGAPGANGRDGKDGTSCQISNGKIVCGSSSVSLDTLKGKPGKDGKDGAPGAGGQDGAPGANGRDGAPGKNGKDGSKGDSCKISSGRIVCGNTFVALDTLKGPKGEDGKDGSNGRNGTNGAPGRDGDSCKISNGKIVCGTTSVNLSSLKGADGRNGTDGRNGANGAPGKDGKDGNIKSCSIKTVDLTSSARNTWLNVKATCDSGKILTSGGCSLPDSFSLQDKLAVSYPISANEWKCTYHKTSTLRVKFSAHAICCN